MTGISGCNSLCYFLSTLPLEMQLDLATRHKIGFLFEQQGLSIRNIAKRLHTTRKAVSLWVKRARGEQSLQNAKGSGRKKSMDNTAASRVVDLLLADDSNTCTQVAKQLHEEGLGDSSCTQNDCFAPC